MLRKLAIACFLLSMGSAFGASHYDRRTVAETITLTDTTDFGAIEHCSIISGSVEVGRWTIATDDTGTGIGDFIDNILTGDTITIATDGTIFDNRAAIKDDAIPSSSPVGSSENTLIYCPSLRLAGSVDGDCTFRVMVNSVETSSRAGAALIYRVSDTSYVFVRYSGSSSLWRFYTGIVESGTRSEFFLGTAANTGEAAWMQIRISGSTCYVESAFSEADLISGTGTYALMDTYSLTTMGTAGELCVLADYIDGTDTVTFEDIKFIDGYAGIAQAYVGDQGTGTAGSYGDTRHLDAGAGNTFDYSSLSATLTNASVTWDVKESISSTFDGSTWDATGLTTAQLQARADSGKRYLQLRANLTATGASPSLDAVSIQKE